MVVVAGTIRIRPDRREEAVTAARELSAASLREPGCRAFRFAFDVDDDTLVHVHEEWDDEESLEAHFTTEHFAAFGAKTPDLVVGDGTFIRFVGAEPRPLMG